MMVDSCYRLIVCLEIIFHDVPVQFLDPFNVFLKLLAHWIILY